MPGSKSTGKHDKPSEGDGHNPISSGKFEKPKDPGGKHSGGSGKK